MLPKEMRNKKIEYQSIVQLYHEKTKLKCMELRHDESNAHYLIEKIATIRFID